jgi:hypothetical protein
MPVRPVVALLGALVAVLLAVGVLAGVGGGNISKVVVLEILVRDKEACDR